MNTRRLRGRTEVRRLDGNTFHGYPYVMEADVVHLVRSALLDNGLCFWSSVVDQQRDGDFAMVCVEFVVTDIETGESLSSTLHVLDRQ